MKFIDIIFLTKYPTKEDLKDGYYQRVFSIDNLLSDYTRCYVNYDSSFFIPHFHRICKNAFEVRVSKFNPVSFIIVAICVIFSKSLYMHSILRLKSVFHKAIFLLSRKRILDVHGVIPEEFEMHGDFDNHKLFNAIEKFALKNADIIIGVTDRMIKYVMQKNNINGDGKSIIILPILPRKKETFNDMKNEDCIKKVIYCGGLQKWQQVDEMLEYAKTNKDKYEFTFLVPDPKQLLDLYRNKYGENFTGVVTSSSPEKVSEWYKENSFGLILRDDIVVNNVACPTKLVEYFQNDLLPIVDSENIGDFKDMGYKYVFYKDELPGWNEWKDMILKNRLAYLKVYDLFRVNSEQLKRLL